MNKQFKILTIVMLLTILVNLFLILFNIKRMEERQIYTTGRVDFINSFCLEE